MTRILCWIATGVLLIDVALAAGRIREEKRELVRIRAALRPDVDRSERPRPMRTSAGEERRAVPDAALPPSVTHEADEPGGVGKAFPAADPGPLLTVLHEFGDVLEVEELRIFARISVNGRVRARVGIDVPERWVSEGDEFRGWEVVHLGRAGTVFQRLLGRKCLHVRFEDLVGSESSVSVPPGPVR